MRRVITTLTAAAALVLLATPAHGETGDATTHMIVGRVAPEIGIAIAADGTASRVSGTMKTIVRRERRGDTVVVSVVPQ